jgi:two-component system NtrC family sensor kinase
MRVSLKAKLVASFVAVIALTGAIATVVSVYFVEDDLLREVQNRVSLDLDSACVLFEARVAGVRSALELTALREFTIQDALRSRTTHMLVRGARDAARVAELDFVGVVDADGVVVGRLDDGEPSGNTKAANQIVARVLRDRTAHAAASVLSRDELSRESGALAERARIRIVPGPDEAAPGASAIESGLVLMGAAPVMGEGGELLGAVYGGVLINGNAAIVDATKETVYRGERYHDRDVGVATVFLNDVRVATNVFKGDGTRALGTRLSPEVAKRVLREGARWSSPASVVGERFFTAYEPLRDIDGEIIGAIAVGVSEEKYAALRAEAFWYLLAVALGGMLVAMVVGYVLAMAIVRPLEHLTRGAAAFAAGEWGRRVRVNSRDELGTLGNTFNVLAEELEKTYERLHGRIDSADSELKEAYAELRERQSQLVHAEKLASVGALAAGVAHEINNPLGVINIYAQLALDELPPDAKGCRENVDVIIKHATRAAQIVQNLLAFARRSELQKGRISVSGLVNDVLRVTEHQARLQGVEMASVLPDDLPEVNGDADKIRQVFVNVIVNALQAMPEGGSLRVTCSSEADRSHVRIVIADTGRGIAPEHADRIFDPFFSTKETGKGTGLGLSVSLGIIEQHSGTIAVESVPGRGTAFTIVLPAAMTSEAP